MNLSELYKNNQKLNEQRQKFHDAIKNNDAEGVSDAFTQMCEVIGDINRKEYQQQLDGMKQELDNSVLYARGVRQLTNNEREYYQAVEKAMRADNPKQALENVTVVFPQTVISRVMEDLASKHPLLSKIQFAPTGGAIRMMLNTDGIHKAKWGKLCAKIVEELTSGFKEVDAGCTSFLHSSLFARHSWIWVPSGWTATSALFWRKLWQTVWKRASSWATATISPLAWCVM